MKENKINCDENLKKIINLKKEENKKIKKRDKNGFTLVEILAVIAIIAILGIITIPTIINTLNNSKTATYNMMINNIKIAGQQLYEEIDYANSELYDYDENGNKGENKIIIDSNIITVTLQGLVNNGFLKGTDNSEEGSDNKNSKVILEPKNNKDIGQCKIKITKMRVSNKVCYKIESSSLEDGLEDICPKTSEYGTCS